MWTRKGGLIVFLAVACIFFGLLTSDMQFMLLAVILFTFFLLVVVLPRPMVEIDRKVNNTVMFENRELNVKMRIRRKRWGFGTVEIYERIPEYSELREGLNHMIYNPTGEETLEYRLKFPLRGYYSVGPTQARIADHFNLFYHDYEMMEKKPLSVFPHIQGLKEFKFKSKKNIHYPGEYLSTQAGSSNEFYHIRDYIKGDPFKKINWKVFARKRELMINEYEKENICDTFLMLDARSISNIGTISENTLEYNIKIALAISNLLLQRRNQVGIVVYNDQVQVLPPKPGVKQINNILRFLTGIYGRGNLELNSALYYAKPYLKSKTTIVLISNLEYDQSLLKSVQWLAALDYRLIIISPSAIDFEVKAIAYNGPQEKLELFRLGRKNFINELRNMGVSVLEYYPEEDFQDIIEKISHEILR